MLLHSLRNLLPSPVSSEQPACERTLHGLSQPSPPHSPLTTDSHRSHVVHRASQIGHRRRALAGNANACRIWANGRQQVLRVQGARSFSPRLPRCSRPAVSIHYTHALFSRVTLPLPKNLPTLNRTCCCPLVLSLLPQHPHLPPPRLLHLRLKRTSKPRRGLSLQRTSSRLPRKPRLQLG